jgi:membrane associated rhomboid family serine protease
MLVLWILGRLLEPAIGTPKFLGVYFAALLAGSFGALLLTPDSPTVGASGAIYGLMGATIVVARERGVQRIAQEIGIWLVLNIVITFSVSGISIGGHLGGLAAGVICGFAVSRLPEQGQWLALSGVAVASVVGSLLSAGAL